MIIKNAEITHNKKRNVGLVYELLLRAVSTYLVEDNKQKAQDVLDIITLHYNNNTELYKEFRLFNALAKTSVSDTSVAAAILSESKQAVRRFDNKKLDYEKSMLLKSINHNLNDKYFFHRWIPNYKELATIQTLINEWNLQDRSDILRLVMLEGKMVEMLITERAPAQTLDIVPDIDSLVIKIMNEKFNNKYVGKLSNEQSELIREYVLMSVTGPSTSLIEKIQLLKNKALESLNIIERTVDNSVLKENLINVRSNIESLDLTELNDNKFSKLMTLSQLINEAKET